MLQGTRRRRYAGCEVWGCRLWCSLALQRELAAGRLVPVLAAGPLELAQSLAQAGTVPVDGTKQHQGQQQQEAEGQPCGQGPGGCGARAGVKVGGAEHRTPREGQQAGRKVTVLRESEGSEVTESGTQQRRGWNKSG